MGIQTSKSDDTRVIARQIGAMHNSLLDQMSQTLKYNHSPSIGQIVATSLLCVREKVAHNQGTPLLKGLVSDLRLPIIPFGFAEFNFEMQVRDPDRQLGMIDIPPEDYLLAESLFESLSQLEGSFRSSIVESKMSGDLLKLYSDIKYILSENEHSVVDRLEKHITQLDDSMSADDYFCGLVMLEIAKNSHAYWLGESLKGNNSKWPLEKKSEDPPRYLLLLGIMDTLGAIAGYTAYKDSLRSEGQNAGQEWSDAECSTWVLCYAFDWSTFFVFHPYIKAEL